MPPPRRSRARRSETQGWTRIAPGDCQVARKEPLTAQSYLVYARSSLAHSGPARAWGGDFPVCVKDGNFVAQAAGDPAHLHRRTAFALPFAPLDNRGKRDWTMNFDEQPAMTLTAAQLAGVKRLLKDNGYAIGAIDGKPDKATGAALTDFRKTHAFRPTRPAMPNCSPALETEARKKIAPAGYTVCNDGHDAAAGGAGPDGPAASGSRGWWTVPPAPAPAPITTPLNSDAVYLLAQKQERRRRWWRAARQFCTAAIGVRDRGHGRIAPARGFAEAGFAATPTKGLSGYVAHIGPAGLGASAGLRAAISK